MNIPSSLELTDNLSRKTVRFRVVGACSKSKLNLVPGKTQIPAPHE